MSPMEAVHGKVWSQTNSAFAIRLEDAAALDKWAARKAGDITRQAERGERDKSKNKREEI